MLFGGEIVGLWRPRKAGTKTKVRVELWIAGSATLRDDAAEQAERLTEFREAPLSSAEFAE